MHLYEMFLLQSRKILNDMLGSLHHWKYARYDRCWFWLWHINEGLELGQSLSYTWPRHGFGLKVLYCAASRTSLQALIACLKSHMCMHSNNARWVSNIMCTCRPSTEANTQKLTVESSILPEKKQYGAGPDYCHSRLGETHQPDKFQLADDGLQETVWHAHCHVSSWHSLQALSWIAACTWSRVLYASLWVLRFKGHHVTEITSTCCDVWAFTCTPCVQRAKTPSQDVVDSSWVERLLHSQQQDINNTH